jgi:hypothetical protein
MDEINCQKILCNTKKEGLNNKKELLLWIKQHHPDKNPNMTSKERDLFDKVLKCYKKGEICNKTNKINSNNNDNNDTKKVKVSQKSRAKIFSCMRKTANFGRIYNYHKFDKHYFNPEKVVEDIKTGSPKLLQMLNNIKQLDANDQKMHGKKFKHFIFSDVKEGGYGAKILASAFNAIGFNNIIKAIKLPKQKKLKLVLDIQKKSDYNFAFLCSNATYGSNFNEKLKKEILKVYNERPTNIHGENVRFIILDSGFKEGIDLFDVKYVHIFEPSLTMADLKQTIGRATRTCGQKGLDFIPNIGWPLYVYNYYVTVPEITQDTMTSKKFLTYNISEADKKEKNEQILLFKGNHKLHDTTMLFSNYDKAMNNLSSQLFELAPLLSVDFDLTKNIHRINDLNHKLMEKDYYLKGGGKGGPIDIFKKINTLSKFYKIDSINCIGKCGKKSTFDIPVSIEYMRKVYLKYNHPKKLIPKQQMRQFFCEYMKNNKDYCEQLNNEWGSRYSYIPQLIEYKNKSLSEIKDSLKKLEVDIVQDEDLFVEHPKYQIIEYKGIIDNTSTNKDNQYIPKQKLPFIAMRNFIKTRYSSKDFNWDKIVIENKCLPKQPEIIDEVQLIDQKNLNKKTNNKKTKKNKKIQEINEIELNPTQKFISNYFCPESPYKGILLWHSVGTGKTCTAIATATASFEKEGYNILWVTRTTLKGDVWKNIFDQICHGILLEELKKGMILPEKLGARKRKLSKSWLEPMSYKQFSNLLLGKNKIYNILKSRNGKEDILKKTLIIIDEAHKLYGGDLKAAERPNMNIMEKLIQNSYQKSGTDSCKLMIMTATPFTNSPLELFKLLNLFMTNDNDKIPTNIEELKSNYMNSNNVLTEDGVKKLANKMSGYISYLNRERDPTQFAQPIIINTPVLMSHIDENDVREAVYLKDELEELNKQINDKLLELKEDTKQIKLEIRDKKSFIETTRKEHNKNCHSTYPGNENKNERKKCLEELKEKLLTHNKDLTDLLQKLDDIQKEYEQMNNDKVEQKEKNKKLKEKIKLIKQSILQEYMLFEKCAHLKYKKLLNNLTKLLTNKSLSKSKSKSKSKSLKKKSLSNSLSKSLKKKSLSKSQYKEKAENIANMSLSVPSKSLTPPIESSSNNSNLSETKKNIPGAKNLSAIKEPQKVKDNEKKYASI